MKCCAERIVQQARLVEEEATARVPGPSMRVGGGLSRAVGRRMYATHRSRQHTGTIGTDGHRRMRHWLSFLFLALAGTAFAQSPPSPMTREALRDFFDRTIPEQLRGKRIPGAVVIVVKDRAVMFSEGYGLADVASQRPMTPDTPVHIASISKAFTALAAMQLVDSGRVWLDTDVQAVVGLPLPGSAVTLTTLLDHEAAFESRAGGIGSPSGQRAALGPFLEWFRPPRLEQPPGVPAYSNYHAALAALVVETVSGQRIEDYWAEHVFRPLGMQRTTAEQPLPADVREQVATGYLNVDRPPDAISMAAATIYEAGSTGIVAPATDMARFMIALLADDPVVVSRDTRDLMLSPHVELPGAYFALGVYSPVADGGNPFVGHDGNTGGYQSSMALLPEERLGIFVSYNAAVPARGELLRRFAERFLGERRSTGAPAVLPKQAATYRPSRRVDSNLFALPQLLGQLRAEPLPDGRLRLLLAAVPVGGWLLENDGTGRFRGGGREVTFGGDAAQVMQLGGAPATYLRVPWWMDARLVMPVLVLCCLIASVVVLAWPLRARRHARTRETEALRAMKTTRFAMALEVAAIAAAWWLVTAGQASVAIAAPATTFVAMAIYAAAWGGVVLAVLAAWRYVLSLAASPRAPVPGLAFEGVLAIVALLLAAFCLYWRIAGTTLAL